MTASVTHSCRHCGATLCTVFVDLGSTPISNAFLKPSQVEGPESHYPLRALVCQTCWLVQLQDFFTGSDLFADDYVYFSSYSQSWLDHARRYAHYMTERLGLDGTSQVIEIASNDGYLLRNFKEQGIAVLGVEPSLSVARVAEQEFGIPTIVKFFGQATALEMAATGANADLMVANNVLAHVPDINDFVAGFAFLLKPEGVATFEFPHLVNLIRETQFDTIYHEHFSYLSLLAVERILGQAGLRVFDVEQLTTHGGSLRVFACLASASHSQQPGVEEVRTIERSASLASAAPYQAFEQSVRESKRSLLELLIRLKRDGKSVVGYGAAAKGNTLLNYCGIGGDMIDYVVDRSPHKQGMFLPGTRLAVLAPEAIDQTKPDYVLILPWNLRDEIVGQFAHIREWGGRFIVPVPRAYVID
jgi:SAM-dependent methyltransferase